MSAVGERFVKLRKALKITQVEFSKQLGITQQFVSQIEKGVREPSDQLLKHICAHYNTTMLWLTDGEGDMFISIEDRIRDMIANVGERPFYDAMKTVLDEHSAVALAILAPRAGTNKDDPELDQMINFLLDLWFVGDEKTKAWAAVQFARAFPPDVQDDVQKKCAKEPGQVSAV